MKTQTRTAIATAFCMLALWSAPAFAVTGINIRFVTSDLWTNSSRKDKDGVAVPKYIVVPDANPNGLVEMCLFTKANWNAGYKDCPEQNRVMKATWKTSGFLKVINFHGVSEPQFFVNLEDIGPGEYAISAAHHEDYDSDFSANWDAIALSQLYHPKSSSKIPFSKVGFTVRAGQTTNVDLHFYYIFRKWPIFPEPDSFNER